jgi:dTDP-glucose 4,6-dehydratase
LLFVDHAVAIDLVFMKEKPRYYNIGGFNEWQNIDLVKLLCKIMDDKLGRATGTSEQLIAYVKDRPGHDFGMRLMLARSIRIVEAPVTLSKDWNVNWYLENQIWLIILLQA